MPQVSDDKAKTASPLAKNLDRLIRAFDELYVDGLRLSEDFSFCHRWRHGCNGQVWANITHQISHVGLQQFRGSYADRLSGGGLVVIKRGEGTVVTGRLAARPRPKNSPRVKP